MFTNSKGNSWFMNSLEPENEQCVSVCLRNVCLGSASSCCVGVMMTLTGTSENILTCQQRHSNGVSCSAFCVWDTQRCFELSYLKYRGCGIIISRFKFFCDLFLGKELFLGLSGCVTHLVTTQHCCRNGES